MLFNSIEFAIFIPVVFVIYWVLKRFSIGAQNLFLVIASYVFYGWWDWRFLSLILFSTVIDYFVALQINITENSKRRFHLLLISVFVNIGVLVFFKYSGFFVVNFANAFTLLGMPFQIKTLNIILPVGISFYTFQTLSYTIDVYKKKLEATGDFISFAAYVSFFPQLVAGPIERATHLLPQFQKERVFSYPKAVDGMKQILWGFFKKMVIADNAARYVNLIYSDSSAYSGSTYVLATIFFAFQIYGDFSGYSDIAIGVSRLFGFDLMTNFRFPYFSRDIAEFWRRWHISLSTWFRDYVYIPLGGSRRSKLRVLFNTAVVFLVSGFWHGANWTFIFWGALHALYFFPMLLSGRNRRNLDNIKLNSFIPAIKDIASVIATFTLVTFSWLFFRASSVTEAFTILTRIFSNSLFSFPSKISHYEKVTIIMIVFMIIVEWMGRNNEHALQSIAKKIHPVFRWSFYSLLACSIALFMSIEQTTFIYFQF